MDELIKTYLNTPVFTFVYIKAFLTVFVINYVVISSIIKVVGERTILLRSILLSNFLSILMIVLRKFISTPYNMLLFYTVIPFAIAVVFKLPLRKSFIGVIFALLLTMLSTVAVTMNLLSFTKIINKVQQSFGAFLLVSLTEVFFNLVYVLLAVKYENLNLSFLFSEEKNAKA